MSYYFVDIVTGEFRYFIFGNIYNAESCCVYNVHQPIWNVLLSKQDVDILDFRERQANAEVDFITKD